MARRLVDAGVEVVGYDVAADAAEKIGARSAKSVKTVVDLCDQILLSLPHSKIIEAVVLGDGGIFDGIKKDQIVVDLSTASPESTRHIHAKFIERGAHYLDAGISGGAAAAEKGTLTLMVGGEEEILQRVTATLEAFAEKIYFLGETGSGHVAKILNNFLNAISLSATAEVMVAAKKANLDLQMFLDVVNNSSGVNFATINRFPKIIHGDYLKGGLSNSLMMKDVVLYSELLSQLAITSANASGPLASFGLAIALGYGDDISNTVVDALGDVSGGIRLHGNGYERESK